ncbi:hypothetical protein CTEN210_07760 [Chaetoceros tenuissimus]|uniref:Sulfotransferase domain-containing protein n=2 Tax=Chaetoceros tenuissimus TaxID=426638 RepID=A0AAD3CSU2_9STRA|nr:hypothetical protein CTEN210_07760 [Chaetoceros tenuissimus]
MESLKSIAEGSNENSNYTSKASVTSADIEDVIKMLDEDEPSSNMIQSTESQTDGHSARSSLGREIEAELASTTYGNGHQEASQRIPDSRTPNHQQIPSDDEEEEGPIIYANHDDDDDFSQITSSIAGNTIYSHEYMFHSISSYPKNKFTTNVNNRSSTRAGTGVDILPSLDGTDNSGRSSSNSGASRVSQLPPMDEKKSLVMDDEDFERFFGNVGSKSGASQRKNAVNRSRDEDEEINIYQPNQNIRVHSNTQFNSHNSVMGDHDDGISVGDIYSYAPSTAGESRYSHGGIPKVQSKNPLIWMYNQAYHIFSVARYRARRKKNDDLDDDTVDDADYFAKLMSTDFTSGGQAVTYSWAKGYKEKKLANIALAVGVFLCLIILVYTGEGTEDIDLIQNEKTKFKTVTVTPPTVGKPAAFRGSKVTVDKSHEGMPLPPIFENFAEVTDMNSKIVPYFWHIPRSAGATLNDVFSICHKLRVATNVGIMGGHDADTELGLVNMGGQMYVNVDISTSQGIQRAVNMGFARQNVADVAISSLLHDSAPLFDVTRKGKIFTMFRHPVDRMVSMFYFMQDNVWKKPTTFNAELANISIENFFVKSLGENNWHVRYLTNQLTKAFVDENDFKLAKEIMRRKVLVGLLSDKDESFARFSKQFKWSSSDPQVNECQTRKLQWDWSLRNPHEVEALEGNRLWELISGQNKYDMQLYEYAKVLFEEQRQLFQ